MSIYYPAPSNAKPSRVIITKDGSYFMVNAYWPNDGIWEPLTHTSTLAEAEKTKDAWLAHSAGTFDYPKN